MDGVTVHLLHHQDGGVAQAPLENLARVAAVPQVEMDGTEDGAARVGGVAQAPLLESRARVVAVPPPRVAEMDGTVVHLLDGDLQAPLQENQARVVEVHPRQVLKNGMEDGASQAGGVNRPARRLGNQARVEVPKDLRVAHPAVVITGVLRLDGIVDGNHHQAQVAESLARVEVATVERVARVRVMSKLVFIYFFFPQIYYIPTNTHS